MKVHSDAYAHISPTHFQADSYSFLLGGKASRAPAKTVEDNKHQQTKKQQNWEISVARPPRLRSLLCSTH